MLDELEFRNHADEQLLKLKNALMDAEEDGGFEAEEQNGVLNVLFPHGTKFVFTPNAPVRQVWISALTTSFKLDWDASASAFVLPKTGEDLLTLTSRLLREQTGNEAISLQ
ncbi:MAG: iron donor protein CyaY [Acidobacteriaceae bacterium]|nr:iron donor protein CyaY [Acidobacteriaceae bacterium]